ncbi:MAG: VWA domain-containing protein [Bacteroidales bacterium]|nr:VWA domain-containing protein [Bacteroidales bacterium]
MMNKNNLSIKNKRAGSHKLCFDYKSLFKYKTLVILSFLLFVFTNGLFSQYSDSLYIEIVGKPEIKKQGSELNDTITLKFNLYKNKGKLNELRGLFLNENKEYKITPRETIGDSKLEKPPEFVEGSLKRLKRGVSSGTDIPSDITISLLVDRSGSIDEMEMGKIKESVKAFAENVPPGCLFFSWFHDDISSSIPLSLENFNEAELNTSNKNTALYNAVYTKLLEFDQSSELPNLAYENALEKNTEISGRNSVNNYLIILTDGKNDVSDIKKYQDSDEFREIFRPELLRLIEKNANNVKIYALGFGENSDDFDEKELKQICMASGNPNGYFLAKPDSIFELLKVRLTDAIAPDYELKLLNEEGKEYQGKLRNLTIEINAPASNINKAVGSVPYALGTTVHPQIVGKESFWGNILKGLITGIVFLLVIMIIIQLIIPSIKNKIFNSKYVIRYKPAENEIRKECPYCGDPLNKGEQVVVKCKHIVHKACWGDYDHVCPEYGQNCDEGKQDYFDISDPFSRKNKIYYLKWVLYGLISGFLTWIFYLMMKDLGIVRNLALGTVQMIRPNISDVNIIELFTLKISSLLLIGILMGFFLTSFFAYIEEFRRKTLAIFGGILLRGLLGSLAGFISFYLGSIILILLNQPYSSFIFDWIPWVIFGASLGFVLSIKTTIVWKYGVLGGLISIIFSFIVLFFVVGDFGYSALLIGFMVFGAGLGFSIATVRSTAEQYFLKIIQGKKHEETIPVHKWMSFQGGHNEVYIGIGFSCEIQMNWEKDNHKIADRHAKMFLNTNRNIPVIVSLEKDKTTTYDGRIEMEPGKEYELFSGNTIKIGNTVFQY